MASSPQAEELTDGQLLERFADRRDEAAFAALMARHGRLVFSVCRRLLDHDQDAEDAFQATFLVLVRQARSIAKRASVASWLYGVAYRVACKARSKRTRQQARQATLPDLPEAEPVPDLFRRELTAVLDEEVNRLPTKYRVPIVLCYLEGKTNEQAARLLGCPVGTVSAQLCRARERLRSRLTRRGVALTSGLLGGILAEAANAAIVPQALCESTAMLVLLATAGRSAAAGVISARVLALTKGVLNTMAAINLSLTALTLLTVGGFVTGTGSIAYHLLAGEPLRARRAVPVKTVMGNDDKNTDTLAEFKKIYALKPGEDLKRVAPPFPKSRADYIRSLWPKAPKDAHVPEFGSMCLSWQSGFHWISGSTPGGFSVRNLPQYLAGIYPQEIEGNQALLDKVIDGDFIVRKDLSAEKFAESLEQVLCRDCGLAVKLTLRDEERKVFVARGKYRYKPLAGHSELAIYGKELLPYSGAGGGTEDIAKMLQSVGAKINRRIINEIEQTPKQKVSWQYHFRTATTADQRQEDRDAGAVLGHLAEQTGLTFKEETRKVRVLRVEP
jgi:RNA polymerase sigma factor (sigma-70 family)